MENVPVSFHVGETSIGFRTIHNDFASTELGEILRNRVRYERYKPAGVQNKVWEAWLGVDVNNLDHMWLTYGLTRQFIRYCPEAFSVEDQEDLLLAATIHDWAEAKVGDHMYDQKTEDHEKEEAFELERMIDGIFGADSTEVLERVNNVVAGVIQDKSSRLGQAFNAIEKLGYLRTGLSAFEAGKKTETEDFEFSQGLQWVANNVLLNQISKLLEYAEKYPAVQVYLESNARRITQAFLELPDELFTLYNEEEITRNKEKYQRAKDRWFTSEFIRLEQKIAITL